MEHSDFNMTPDMVLQQLRAIAMAKATELLAVRDGELVIKETDALDEDLSVAIAAMEKGSGGIKVKFYDKLRALELLGKAMGVFERQPEPQGADSPLLRAILDSTKEVISTHDIPEIQQAAASGDDMVEPTGAEG